MAKEKEVKKKKKRKKRSASTIALVVIFFVGLSLLLYPSVSDYYNSFHQSRAIAGYTEQVAKLDDGQYDKILASAREYNTKLADKTMGIMSDEQLADYNQQLNVAGNGVIGYVDIPVINVNLPIYHGTDDAVLQIAVGHIEWSSLPVDGESVHGILSGHRGLPSAKLFSDLDRVVLGDIFTVRVLDEVFTYEVDDINVVLPEEVNTLGIQPGHEYVTLVTCTPYGINSHRMLVRGHRIETIEDKIYHVSADAQMIEPIMVAPFIAGFMLAFLLLLLIITSTRLSNLNEEEET